MTERRIDKKRINLQGPEGNAFVLMGLLQDSFKKLDKDPDPILEEMKNSGDYKQLCRIFIRELGDFYYFDGDDELLAEIGV